MHVLAPPPKLPDKVREGEGAFASTRDACAPRNRKQREMVDHKMSILAGSIVGGLAATRAFVRDSDDFDFDAGAFGQAGDLNS